MLVSMRGLVSARRTLRSGGGVHHRGCGVWIFLGLIISPTMAIIRSFPAQFPSIGGFISGSPIKCKAAQEGAVIKVPTISNNPCIHCRCEKQVIQCRRETCPVPRGCYFLQVDRKDVCCNVCKSCTYNGTIVSSPSEWTLPEDPCKRLLCQSGVLTQSKDVCDVPCKNPLPPAKNECCPSCKGCWHKGVEYKEGETFHIEKDKCTECICKRGNIQCVKKACPVLACPFNRILKPSNGCCPICHGTKRLENTGSRCLMGSEIFDNGSTWPLDSCTTCKCNNGTSHCERTVCPRLACPPEHQITNTEGCCPRCRNPEQQNEICFYNKRAYSNGDTWKVNKCTKCACNEGKVSCAVEQCSQNLQCPPGHKLSHQKTDCCPTCVEQDGVCTVFGDPHYKTFDGKMFNFQGHCRYTLVTDECSGSLESDRSTFSIQAVNDPRYSRRFTWTRAILVRVGDYKVRLGRFPRVRVDRKRVKLPLVKLGVLSVHLVDHHIILRINNGINVIWDGDNIVEIHASPKYKNKLCGLCGNYNNNENDDFMTKNGTIVRNEVTFANEWMIGRRRRCLRPVSAISRTECRNRNKLQRFSHSCDLIKSNTFKHCHKAVDAIPYFKACMLDMCECRHNDLCYCDALSAYAAECRRHVTDVAGALNTWKNDTKCEGMYCPRHSHYHGCGVTCRRTCKNRTKTEMCYKSVTCKPGCQCSRGLVWHKGKCIPESMCPLPLIAPPPLLST